MYKGDEFSEPLRPAVIIGKGVCVFMTAVLMHVAHPNRAACQFSVISDELYCRRSFQQKRLISLISSLILVLLLLALCKWIAAV